MTPVQERVSPIPVPRTMLATLLVCGTVFMLSALLIWVQHGFDRAVLAWCYGARESAVVVQLAQALTQYGMSLIAFGLLTYMVATFVIPSLADTHRLFVVFLLSFAVIGFGGDLLKEVVKRPRPPSENALKAKAESNSDTPSFPSGHATKSLSLALPFVIFVPSRKRWIFLLKGALVIVALGVGCARILLGRHYVSDVLGAFGLVLLLLPVLVLACNQLLKRMPVAKLRSAAKVWTLGLLGLAVLLIFL
jgi:membrane-associated phospholipid phosphatase